MYLAVVLYVTSAVEVSPEYAVQILTVEFAVDLGNGLRWGKPTLRCL
jgi:hypothetical protein